MFFSHRLVGGPGLAVAVLAFAAAQALYAEAQTDAPSERETSTFLVFGALGYAGRPDLQELGIRPITILYGSTIWGPGQSRERPDENRIRTLARNAARRGHLVCVDIEHWPLRNAPDAVVQDSIRKFQNVADWMHHAEPGLRLGFYSMLPVRDYWAPVDAKPEAIAEWQAVNARLDSIAAKVDVVFPSLYTFYEDQEGWRTYAEANIEQARRYGKSVYVFLWPQYHPSNERVGGQHLPGDYWRMQLDFCREHADGVVIWGGYDPEATWDESAPWWQETKAFLDSLR